MMQSDVFFVSNIVQACGLRILLLVLHVIILLMESAVIISVHLTMVILKTGVYFRLVMKSRVVVLLLVTTIPLELSLITRWHGQLCESMVLMKNNDRTLPLESNDGRP